MSAGLGEGRWNMMFSGTLFDFFMLDSRFEKLSGFRVHHVGSGMDLYSVYFLLLTTLAHRRAHAGPAWEISVYPLPCMPFRKSTARTCPTLWNFAGENSTRTNGGAASEKSAEAPSSTSCSQPSTARRSMRTARPGGS